MNTPVIAQAMSSILQGYGQYQSGQAQGSALRYNAEVAELDAKARREQASYEAQMIRKQGQRIIGAQRNAFASSGFATTSGTPLSVVASTARKAEADARLRQYRGNVESSQLQNQAALMRAKASSVESAGKSAMFGTILTGLGQAYASGEELGIWKKDTSSSTRRVGGPVIHDPLYDDHGWSLISP